MSRIAGVTEGLDPHELSLWLRAMFESVGISDIASEGHGSARIGAAPTKNSFFADDRVIIALDGFVYNLEDFPTSFGGEGGDAGRLATSYRAHGLERTLSRLNGDFGLAVFDRSTRALYLARDRFGIRPLYYLDQPGMFAFASRVRSLRCLPGVNLSPSAEKIALWAVANYRLFDNHIDASPFEAIKQLPLGTFLVRRDGRTTILRYWSLAEIPDRGGPAKERAESYRELFRDAVSIRLCRTERPVFTLSGGLDSSSVLMMAQSVSGRRETAISSVYSDETYDESDEIADIVRAGIGEWIPFRIDEPDLLDQVRRLITLHDEPVVTVTWLAHYLLVREARDRGFTAIFGGLGGDEQHAGEYDYFFYFFADLLAAGKQEVYHREVAAWQRNHDHPIYRKSPEIAADMLAVVIDNSCPGGIRPNRQYLDRYCGALNPAFFDLGRYQPEMESPFDSHLKNHMFNEVCRGSLPPCLRAGDRNTQALGIEEVMPFLDHRLVEWMFRVPGDMKINSGTTKQYLRKAMKSMLPDATRLRVAKTGWNAPAHVWFSRPAMRDRLLDMVRSRRLRESGIYDTAAVEDLVNEHFDIVNSGQTREHHMMFLWQLINLDAWLEDLGTAVGVADGKPGSKQPPEWEERKREALR